VNASAVLLIPLIVQGAAMGFDELYFHRKRGLGLWERIGHPLDTLTVVACFGWVLLVTPTRTAVASYVALAAMSCLIITKDEWVHARRCSPGEHWVHALLFLVHPVTLASAGMLWPALHARPALLPWATADRSLFFVVGGQFVLTAAFCIYQVAYWNLPWPHGVLRGR
jgi:hypothetical protein